MIARRVRFTDRLPLNIEARHDGLGSYFVILGPAGGEIVQWEEAFELGWLEVIPFPEPETIGSFL